MANTEDTNGSEVSSVDEEESAGCCPEIDTNTKMCLWVGLVLLGAFIVVACSGVGTYYVVRHINSTTVVVTKAPCNCPMPSTCRPPSLPVCPPTPPARCDHPLEPVTVDPRLPGCRPGCPTAAPCNRLNCGLKATNCPAIRPTTPKPTPTTSLSQLQSMLSNDWEFKSKTVVEWIGLTPLNSPERLYVVTTLMERTVEGHVRIMSRRNCRKDNLYRKRRLCTLCMDRYDYLRCVLKTNVTRNKMGHRDSYRIAPVPSYSQYWAHQYYFAQAAYWETNEVWGYFNHENYETMENVRDAFWVLSDDGEVECRLCFDFNRIDHPNCIRFGYQGPQ